MRLPRVVQTIGVGTAAAMSLLGAGVLQAQQRTTRNVRGVVTDTIGVPVALAQVSVGQRPPAITSDSGTFEILIESDGPYDVRVRRLGYHPRQVRLAGAPDSSLRLVLVPTAVRLESVRVDSERTIRSLELNGFYSRMEDRRKGANTGHFITPEDLEKRRTSRATLLLEGVPGVRILRHYRYWSVFGTGRTMGRRDCPMTIYLDGARLNALSESEPLDLDWLIQPTSIAGIEVYSRTNAPPEYQLLNGTCGVVLFWTKSG